METFWRSLRYTLRVLGKNPGFTSVAILSLALGIGANTAIFTLINALFLRGLPVRQPERLVQLSPIRQGDKITFSYPNVPRSRTRPTGLLLSYGLEHERPYLAQLLFLKSRSSAMSFGNANSAPPPMSCVNRSVSKAILSQSLASPANGSPASRPASRPKLLFPSRPYL